MEKDIIQSLYQSTKSTTQVIATALINKGKRKKGIKDQSKKITLEKTEQRNTKAKLGKGAPVKSLEENALLKRS